MSLLKPLYGIWGLNHENFFYFSKPAVCTSLIVAILIEDSSFEIPLVFENMSVSGFNLAIFK